MSVEMSTARARVDRDATSCPNCLADGLQPFYEARGLPAHSVLLMHDRAEARLYPRGDLRLAFCPGCGFITNVLFDVALNEYSPEYEETQHCSPHFDRWARQLVDRLVRDYDLTGKRILEIGCGKGEFLALLCEAGNSRGVGIDPSCMPERLQGRGVPGVTFIRDVYSEQYAHLPADVVCCRHTLEHIQPTHDFMRMIRGAIGGRLDTLVFFEVPDMARVLRERAFWDIYYEHCSYFTAGALARLFRATGFELLELVRDYGDQYLWVMARPLEDPPSTRFPLEEELDDLQRQVAAFAARCSGDIARWRTRIQEFARAGRRPVIWGAGSKCVAFVTTLGLDGEVEYVVDINPRKVGKYLPGSGHPVVGPEFLASYRPGVVIAMNPVYRDEIEAALRAMRVRAEILPV